MLEYRSILVQAEQAIFKVANEDALINLDWPFPELLDEDSIFLVEEYLTALNDNFHRLYLQKLSDFILKDLGWHWILSSIDVDSVEVIAPDLA